MSTFLAMSVSGGALILVIAVLRALFAQRLPRRLLCALWAVALLRLLLPVFPPSPLSLLPAVESGGGEALPAVAAPTAAPQTVVSTVAPGAATLDLRAVRDESGSLTGLRVATAEESAAGEDEMHEGDAPPAAGRPARLRRGGGRLVLTAKETSR